MYDNKINKQRGKALCRLDQMAFLKIKQLMTWHALGKVILFMVFFIPHEF